MSSKNSKLNKYQMILIKQNHPNKIPELIKLPELKSKYIEFVFSYDCFDNFIPVSHNGVFIHFPNEKRMYLLNKKYILKEFDLTGLVKHVGLSKVESIFVYGVSLVKLGRKIFRIVGFDLYLIGSIENSNFSYYCCNFLVFNRYIYVGGRNSDLYHINVHERKLVRVKFNTSYIATRSMADKGIYFDFDNYSTRIFNDAENPTIFSYSSSFFSLGVIYFSNSTTLMKVFYNFEYTIKETKQSLVLGKYGIMLSKNQIGDYYDVVESYMKQFVNEHFESSQYVETELDYICGFYVMRQKRFYKLEYSRIQMTYKKYINKNKRNIVYHTYNSLDSCCFPLYSIFEEATE